MNKFPDIGFLWSGIANFGKLTLVQFPHCLSISHGVSSLTISNSLAGRWVLSSHLVSCVLSDVSIEQKQQVERLSGEKKVTYWKRKVRPAKAHFHVSGSKSRPWQSARGRASVTHRPLSVFVRGATNGSFLGHWAKRRRNTVSHQTQSGLGICPPGAKDLDERAETGGNPIFRVRSSPRFFLKENRPF